MVLVPFAETKGTRRVGAKPHINFSQPHPEKPMRQRRAKEASFDMSQERCCSYKKRYFLLANQQATILHKKWDEDQCQNSRKLDQDIERWA